MALSAEFLEFLKDQMSGFGAVSIRRMFGGAGISRGEVTFAIVVDESLYLKTDGLSDALFDAEKLENFYYTAKGGKRIEMSYRRAPARVMDDADEMALWCGRAYEAALRAKSPAKKQHRSR